MSIADAAASARAVTEAILGDLAKAERGVVVDSPPGAGKSTLVVAAAASLAERGEPVMVVGQTNEQVDDLIDRLASEHAVLAHGAHHRGAREHGPRQFGDRGPRRALAVGHR
jgi:predicted PilT family ATPase